MLNPINSDDILVVLIQSNEYSYGIYSGGNFVPVTSPNVKAGGVVQFVNQCSDYCGPVYILPDDNHPCPFTEAWPTCIPYQDSVFRKVFDDIQLITPGQELSFSFMTFDVGRNDMNPPNMKDSLLGQPNSSGEVIVTN